jgi:indolepyruvate ferredoxin oxidoreductase
MGASDLESIVADRSRRLRAYWNDAYASRYERLVRGIDASAPDELRQMVARELFRVMAYKDEYEVARMLTSPAFRQDVDRLFGDGVKVSYNLAPPVLSGDASPTKRRFGPWLRVPLAMLARLRGLRETPLDVFGRSDERRRERAWRDRYVRFAESLANLGADADPERLLQIAQLPASVRGFGHIKSKAMDEALLRWDVLEQRVASSNPERPAARVA